MDNPKLKIIEKLAGGYSNLAKITNQFWLTLIIVSTVAIISNTGNVKKIKLPFGLGEANKSDFYTTSLILICILTIAFTSSMIQAIRTRKLIQNEIDTMPIQERFISNTHIQDYLDSILSPTYNKVAPISQFLQGKNQFFKKDAEERGKRIVPILYYVILKLVSFLFMYFVPIISIIMCYCRIELNDESVIRFSKGIYLPIIFLSLSSILILVIGDLKYLKNVIKRISKKQ
jgi:hypothetical protein